MERVNLWIDIESRSELDLKEVGLDNYSKHPSTQITLFGWCINDALPTMWRPWERPEAPEELRLMLTRPEIYKFCFNSQFEQTMLRACLGIDIPTEQFVDVATHCKYASIAGNLEFCGDVIGIDADDAKMAIGKSLIAKFCKPKKITKKDPTGGFSDWNSHPEEWAQFEAYCANDIIAERAIFYKLKAFQLPPNERKIWCLDQKINTRGIPIDTKFVANCDKFVEDEKSLLMKEFRDLTGLENPNSVKQLLGWLKTKGYPYNSLGAPRVKAALEASKACAASDAMPTAGERALELRQLLAKSSTAKLQAIKDLIGADDRLRFQYVYGGAARTLRWSGRGAQPQNFPRPSIKDVEGATNAILAGDLTALRTCGPVLGAVSSCLRGAIKAETGKVLVACDLSSIETVGSAWLTDCTPLLAVFAAGKDPYIDFATKMFGVPYEVVTKEQRQMSKPAVLGACYGLGGGEMGVDTAGDDIRTGLWGYALNMGQDLPQDFCHDCVKTYRDVYSEIKDQWRQLEMAAGKACLEGKRYTACRCHFDAVPGKILYITLPSGRRLHYLKPKVSEYLWFGKPSYKISYENNILGGWGRVHTFGGKILENIVQAFSRDILTAGMLRATELGFSIIMHSHDEIVAEETIGSSLNGEKLREAMVAPQAWAPGLPLKAEPSESERYKK
jgi:DNA polymerase